MSFALTTEQMLARTKTVTRRLGWAFVKSGDCLLAVDKQRVKDARRLAVIQVVSARWEPLEDITAADCAAEGFPGMSPAAFCAMFRREMWTQVRKQAAALSVRRIEFRYREDLYQWVREQDFAKKLVTRTGVWGPMPAKVVAP